MKGQTCCFTGHRELDEDEGEIKNRLRTIIRLLIAKNIIYYISGAAKGFDLLAAETVLELRKEFPQIRLVLEIPCRNQSQGWGDIDQKRYQQILQSADETQILSEHYFRGCMQKRNRVMVEKSAICVCYRRRFSGGTQYTVAYAEKNKLLLIFL
ncbi:MAG: DUF1273 family protein [Clostridia bacterium]|nr:DUF1273 family protein [Clostridia bacterium]